MDAWTHIYIHTMTVSLLLLFVVSYTLQRLACRRLATHAHAFAQPRRPVESLLVQGPRDPSNGTVQGQGRALAPRGSCDSPFWVILLGEARSGQRLYHIFRPVYSREGTGKGSQVLLPRVGFIA
jgi:hypothetical protein